MKKQLAVTLNKIPEERKNKLISDLINKRTKLELLQKKNIDLLEEIDGIRAIFEENTKDTAQEFIEIKEEFIQELIDKSKSKSLTKWQSEVLSDIIFDEFKILTELFGLSEKAGKMMLDFQKASQEKLSKMEKMLLNEMMNDMKDEMDLPEDFDFEKMYDEDYFEKMQKEMHEKGFEEENKQKQDERYKNQQNLDIDFKQLYRKLVKFSHPDLVSSEEEKEKFEKIIKRINAAWKDLNYYELIIIWMEIDPNNELEVELTEKNCKLMIKHLNEKLKIVEVEKYVIKYKNPKTAFLFNNFYAKKDKTIITKIDKFNMYINNSIVETGEKMEQIKTISGLKRILTYIYDKEYSNF